MSKVRFLHSGEGLRNVTLLFAEEGERGHLSLHMNGSHSTKLSRQLRLSGLPECKWWCISGDLSASLSVGSRPEFKSISLCLILGWVLNFSEPVSSVVRGE